MVNAKPKWLPQEVEPYTIPPIAKESQKGNKKK